MDWYEVRERLALTADGRVVAEDHVDARWLYAIPGHRIPMGEALRHGLVEGAGKAAEAPEPVSDPAVSPEPEAPAEEPVSAPAPEPGANPVKRPRGRPRKVRE